MFLNGMTMEHRFWAHFSMNRQKQLIQEIFDRRTTTESLLATDYSDKLGSGLRELWVFGDNVNKKQSAAPAYVSERSSTGIAAPSSSDTLQSAPSKCVNFWRRVFQQGSKT